MFGVTKNSKPASILLAGLLQFAPLAARLAQSCPGLATSPIAIVMTWIVRVAIVAGSYHAISAGSAALASPTTATGKVGTATSYQIRINDGVNRVPESWRIKGTLYGTSGSTTNGMPPGLKLGLSTGIINGTPTQSGSFPTTITAYESPGGGGAALTFTVTFNIAANTVPTTILTNPVGANLHVGEPLNLVVAAGGSSPLTYQWQKDTVNIPGATATNYTIAAVVSTNAGSYRAVVTGGGGTTNSAAAVITVTPLQITLPTHTASSTAMHLETVAGRHYVIQATPTLTPPAWAPAGEANASSSDTLFSDNVVTNATRFWRYYPTP